MKRASVCISQIGSGTGGGCTKGARREGRKSSSSSMVRLYAVGATFGGIAEAPSCVVEPLKQN